MPIIQNNLVWKSIEALHDEAVATMPDVATDVGIIKSRPTAILNQASNKDLPLQAKTDYDVMTRIDHLLKKLDEDKDTLPRIASNKVDLDTTQTLVDRDRVALSMNETALIAEATNDAHEIAANGAEGTSQSDHLDLTSSDLAETDNAPDSSQGVLTDGLSDISSLETNDTKMSSDLTSNVNKDYIDNNDKDHALTDIANAIHQAQQGPAEPIAPAINQELAPSFDTVILSKTIADEVRSTISVLIASEMKDIVRQAVGDAIHDMREVAPDLSELAADKKSPAKSRPKRKTAASKKPVKTRTTAKKVSNKKAASKKTNAKKSAG